MRCWWLILLAGAVLIAGLAVATRRHDWQEPQASARGLFPASLEMDQAFNDSRVVLRKAWAATPAQEAFDVKIPASRRAQFLFILCSKGRQSIDFGGSEASGPCTGAVKGVIGSPWRPGEGGHVRLSVAQKQDATWGFAVYEAIR